MKWRMIHNQGKLILDTVTPRLHPKLSLHSQTESSQGPVVQILHQVVVWSDPAGVCSPGVWKCSEATAASAKPSTPCLLASQHTHILCWQSLGFSILSNCPSSSPSSQGILSTLSRTVGLGNALCGWTHSFPRARVCSLKTSLPFRSLQGFEVPTLCLFAVQLSHMEIFPVALVMWEFFCQFPVSFTCEFFHRKIYF